MTFKFKNENGELIEGAKSQSSTDSLFNSIAKKTPKQEQLALFKTVIQQMLKEGKSDKEILAFTENPSSATRYGATASSDLDCAFFGGMTRYTTKEEREKILIEVGDA